MVTDVRLLHYVRWCYRYGHTVPSTFVLLIDLFSVLTEKRSTRLLVEELVTSLAQEHKPRFVQVLIISSELVVNIEVMSPSVVLTTELTGLIAAGQHILAEHLPLGSSTKFIVLLFQYLIIV